MKITIYIRDKCRFCDQAQSLLRKKQLDFNVINASNNENLRTQMIEKSGRRRTFPQIFVDDKPIGGCDDLYALEASGDLDKLLQGGMR